MRRAIVNSLLSVLLLTTLVWGGCVSCEQYFMWPGVKSCCSPNGHCKTKTPPSRNSNLECKQLAFDHDKPFDLPIDLPVVALVKIELPVFTIQALEHWRDSRLIEPSPPDLQIFHSTFLI